MTKIPTNLKYTQDHEWAEINGNCAVIGITDFAQDKLGDIVFVELPEIGTILEKGSVFGTVESIKSVSDLYAPLSGKIIDVNSTLEDQPELLNNAPYHNWIIKIEFRNSHDAKELLAPSDYEKICSDND